MDPVTIIAYLIAIIIPAFVIYLFYAIDVFGTGRTSTVLICVTWGIVGAYHIAVLVNDTVTSVGLSYEALTRVTAPVIEEILKSLILIYLVRQPSFRYIVDGAVYGIAVGIGFALSENLFVYLPNSGSAVLGTAITRTLSTALMHATAGGLVGLGLGRLRRSTATRRTVWPLLGILLAIALHVVYNNLVGELGGTMLLLVAIGIGVGGGIVIAWQINQGLVDEKLRFSETLGLNVGVSTGERKAVQQLGGASIEQIFSELEEFFGSENTTLVRRLLVVQANIGILQNNLNGPASERLRRAWEEEIAAYRAEIDILRKALGAPVRLFLQSVFPSDDLAMQAALNEEIGRFDPTLVHTFDMFMRVSELAETFKPEQLAAMAERLHRIEVFRNVSLANLENLSRAIAVQQLRAGEVLFDEGDEGDAMYLIEQGTIDISVRDPAGEKKLLRTFRPGDVVGEFSLLDGQPRSARAQVCEPVTLLTLQREVFTMFIQSRPQVVLAMLQYLAEKVRYTTLSVEASVNWMTRISQGNYQMPESLVVTQPVPLVVPDAPEKIEEPAVALEPGAISAQTPGIVSGVLSAAAVSLQERENLIRTGTLPKAS